MLYNVVLVSAVQQIESAICLHIFPFSFFVFVCGCLLFQPFVEENTFAPLCFLCSFVEDQLVIFIGVCFWVLYSVSLIHLSILLPTPCRFDCHNFPALNPDSVHSSSSSILCWLFWIICQEVKQIIQMLITGVLKCLNNTSRRLRNRRDNITKSTVLCFSFQLFST